MYLPSSNDPHEWNSACDYAHVGPNTKFVTEGKLKAILYVMTYEIFTSTDVNTW